MLLSQPTETLLGKGSILRFWKWMFLPECPLLHPVILPMHCATYSMCHFLVAKHFHCFIFILCYIFLVVCITFVTYTTGDAFINRICIWEPKLVIFMIYQVNTYFKNKILLVSQNVISIIVWCYCHNFVFYSWIKSRRRHNSKRYITDWRCTTK